MGGLTSSPVIVRNIEPDVPYYQTRQMTIKPNQALCINDKTGLLLCSVEPVKGAPNTVSVSTWDKNTMLRLNTEGGWGPPILGRTIDLNKLGNPAIMINHNYRQMVISRGTPVTTEAGLQSMTFSLNGDLSIEVVDLQN